MRANEIHHELGDVDARLASLQLDRQVLIDSLLQANIYRVRMTSHHPRLYRYAALTCETVAALRDFLVPRGWQKADEGHYELVVNPELHVAIAVASGDAGTGDKDRIPSNKSEKGPRTVKAVDDNRTADLFPETLPDASDVEQTFDTWILLHRLIGNQIRLELSRPNDYDATERFVISWSERILVGTITLDGDRMQLPISPLPDVDFVVTRKSA